ncbi:hypothetical protein A3B49_02945 [Candidatus Daviesbacteria bacterium RIFCSPLOWO2_01_FULL_40_24]|uniref:Uncharacterized protein n=1 Tax=Candidatus Daviesbacteria bacterium RIFCSPLOWO2_01_FULL_40_24 TaxID=1797787 RepID=A0A1F5MJZ8_9BACT|nr:MAG: hypothetical protein A3B49_02945 [Candidatus Daviesbacteria bacterium RIFCSPLOWO2_01_FULL_40_24]
MGIEHMGDNSGAEFLQQKYQLNKDPGVVITAKRHEKRTGESVDQGDFSTRIQNYLDRLHGVINPPKLLEGHDNFDRQERNVTLLKHGLHRDFVTKPETIPESYYDAIKRKHKEEGHGDIEIPPVNRQELAQTIVEDQKRSLDLWIDYLVSDDAKYPDWLKYFAFRSVLGMGNYDKNRGVFNERTRGGRTTAPFPELNREALAIVLDDLEKKYPNDQLKPGNRTNFEFTSRFDISGDAKQKYLKALDNKNFSQLYGLAIEEFKPIGEELLKITEGRWVKYPSGSDPKQLVSSIANYGTGWCLRGEAVARRYLVNDKNDLHVYYSNDQAGDAVVPRVVMVINQNGSITEVRGVATQEHLDAHIGDVVDTKLSEPEFEQEGKMYKKRSVDMRTLTAIDHKIKTGQNLSGEDLTFLYEIDAPIEGFGYNRDPRIDAIRSQRIPDEDMPVVFGCEIQQIARNPSEIRPDTKAYVGPLQADVFELLSKYGIDHIYTKFPEVKIRIEELEIERKTKAELKQKLDGNDIKWRKSDGSYAETMIDNPDFPNEINKQSLTLVTLKVSDLGFDKGTPTTDQIYDKAKELGLELCPPEVGPEYRIAYKNQKVGEWCYIAMKQISGSYGGPGVFGLGRRGDELWLYDGWARPAREWALVNRFVFSLRKPSEPQVPQI